jgi:hypothetical protein
VAKQHSDAVQFREEQIVSEAFAVEFAGHTKPLQTWLGMQQSVRLQAMEVHTVGSGFAVKFAAGQR